MNLQQAKQALKDAKKAQQDFLNQEAQHRRAVELAQQRIEEIKAQEIQHAIMAGETNDARLMDRNRQAVTELHGQLESALPAMQAILDGLLATIQEVDASFQAQVENRLGTERAEQDRRLMQAKGDTLAAGASKMPLPKRLKLGYADCLETAVLAWVARGDTQLQWLRKALAVAILAMPLDLLLDLQPGQTQHLQSLTEVFWTHKSAKLGRRTSTIA